MRRDEQKIREFMRVLLPIQRRLIEKYGIRAFNGSRQLRQERMRKNYLRIEV